MFVFAGLRGLTIWSALTVIASLGILLNNVIYFPAVFSPGMPPFEAPRFFLEKGVWANQAWWLAAFYFHIVGASICLALGIPLMFPRWTRAHPVWHRVLGYIYLNAVLWMAAPAGIALATVAKGGLWGSAAFMVAGLLWWFTTWQGYQSILRRDVNLHIRWMVRSYSWALSAPAFRLIQMGLFFCGLDDGANYLVSLWLSLAVSVVLAESCIIRTGRGAAVAKLNPSSQIGVVP